MFFDVDGMMLPFYSFFFFFFFGGVGVGGGFGTKYQSPTLAVSKIDYVHVSNIGINHNYCHQHNYLLLDHNFML